MGKYNRRGRHFCYMCENDNNIRERQLFHYQSLDIIVAVGDAAAALAHGRQLAAMLPAVGPRSVVQGVAYGIVGDGLPIERRQQVRPISVAVGIGAACCPDVADKRRPRPSAGIPIPPRRVPDPPGREVFPRAAGFQIACVPRLSAVEKSKPAASERWHALY